MSKNPVSGKLDPMFHSWIQEEAKKRKTSMLKLQKRIARNAQLRVVDVLDDGQSFFE